MRAQIEVLFAKRNPCEGFCVEAARRSTPKAWPAGQCWLGLNLGRLVPAVSFAGWRLPGHTPRPQGFEGFLPRSVHRAAYGEDVQLLVGQLQEVRLVLLLLVAGRVRGPCAGGASVVGSVGQNTHVPVRLCGASANYDGWAGPGCRRGRTFEGHASGRVRIDIGFELGAFS